MSDTEPETIAEDLSKRKRLVNAWLAGGPDVKNSVIAEIAAASTGYASRIRNNMKSGEISEAEVQDERDEELVDAYTEQLRELDAAVQETAWEPSPPTTPTVENRPTNVPNGRTHLPTRSPLEPSDRMRRSPGKHHLNGRLDGAQARNRRNKPRSSSPRNRPATRRLRANDLNSAHDS
ncbi:hypothetical protein VB773_19450 [Haloarculaceae archaeon H-GB2-1]|nr:hypothetical protein [Haloarculaceae archaeon H-GB11]MEA5409536.1 hypothetical protein [Haloarculaceae archaeon H-GB2-1]